MKKQKSSKIKFSKSGQSRFGSRDFQSRYEFGGELLKKAKNRCARPISSKETMHVVLKSTKAVGQFSFGYKGNPVVVKAILDKACVKYGVKFIGYANSSNHLHLHLKFPSRAVYLKFIRSVTAAIAMAVTGAAKLRGLTLIIGAAKFFDFRPFTRIVRGLRGFRVVQDYVRLNAFEAVGLIPKRLGRLRDLEPLEKRFFNIKSV